MKTRVLVPLMFLLSAPLVGCDDDDQPSPPNTERADGAVGGAGGAIATVGDAGADSALTADAGDSGTAADASADGAVAACAVAAPAGPTAAAGIAIVSSDRMSTTISLAALGGTVLTRDNCLTSGTVSPQLSAALSGDVVLPLSPQPGNELAVIDRKNATITWVDPAACTVKRQMNVGTGFAANPYDLVGGLGGNKGYVLRYNANPGNAAEGSDLLIIDTACGSVKGKIDLRASAGVGPAGATILPDPARAALIGGKVYVVLNDLSSDYSTAGVGRLAIVDPATDTVSGTIDLPGLKNCGTLDAVKTATGDALVVGCNGLFGDPMQLASAGMAWVDLSVSPAKVTVTPATPFAQPVSGFDVAATADAGFTVVAGDFTGPRTDAVWSVDWKTGAASMRYTADSSFSLSLAIDHARQTLYVLDAAKAMPRVHVFGIAAGVPTETAAFVSNPTPGLPPRQLAFY